MMECTYPGATLGELLNRPKDLLVLVGAEDSGGSGDGDNKGGDSGGSGDNSNNGDDKGGDGETPEQLKRRLANYEEERGRLVNKRQAAEARVTELESEVAELKKNGTKDENILRENEDLKSRVTQLESELNSLRIKTEFVTDNTHKWVDADAAFKLADLSEVEIDKSGKVVGLKAAMDKLAKERKFLLVADNSNDGSGDGKPPARKSGETPGAPGGTNTQAARTAEDAKLLGKYAALRGR